MRISLFGPLLVFILVLTPGVARAGPIIGLPFHNNEGSLTALTPPYGLADGVMGFRFDVVSEITVDALGVYDYLGDGLSSSHQVGLWNSGGTLLASGLVSAGTASPLDAPAPNGYFRMVGISDTVLPIGTGYQVGALYAADDGDVGILGRYSPSTIAVNPSITFDRSRYAFGSSLTAPTADVYLPLSNAYFGASFNVIPEPTTLALLLSGSLAFGAVALRRRDSHDS
ncbi:PEP-CTERM sorting domain-containing protein [Planctomycetota bacterium]